MISNKRMLPLIIFGVLWENSDEEHPISIDEIVALVRDIYLPKDEVKERSFRILVTRYLNETCDFFEDLIDYGLAKCDMKIDSVYMKCADGSRRKHYFISGRPLDDTDLRVLSDAMFFAPGIGIKQTNKLLRKITMLSSRYFGNIFRHFHMLSPAKKTVNERLFEFLKIINEAINKRKKVLLGYRGQALITMTPYFITVYAGRHYCIGNGEDDEFSHYRFDRVDSIVLTDEPARDMSTINGVNKNTFTFTDYLRRHPRMTRDEVISVRVMTKESFIDKIRDEFEITFEGSARPVDGDDCRVVRIESCKMAIANWFINVVDMAWIVDDDSGVSEIMRMRAEEVIRCYGE